MSTKEAQTRAYKAQKERYRAMGLKAREVWLDDETAKMLRTLGSPFEQNESLKKLLTKVI